jgi:hypothetical protein
MMATWFYQDDGGDAHPPPQMVDAGGRGGPCQCLTYFLAAAY